MLEIKDKIFNILLNHTLADRTTAAEEIANLFHKEFQQSDATPVWTKATRRNICQSAVLRDSVVVENYIHQWRIAGWDNKGVKFTNGIIKEWWELEILQEENMSEARSKDRELLHFAQWLDEMRNTFSAIWEDTKIWGSEDAFKKVLDIWSKQKEK